MRNSNISLFYRCVSAFLIIICGSVIQWVLIGGANPLRQLLPQDVSLTNRKGKIDSEPELRTIVLHHSTFQLGMIFPRWGKQAYGTDDPAWESGLIDIYSQTGSQWIELTINFYQPSITSPDIQATAMVPTTTALMKGIQIAHALGYRVLVAPLLTVGGAIVWSGYIHFSILSQEQKWFDSYWRTIYPYVKAANQAKADEFAIGTEYEQLQQAPASLWHQLITRFHNSFNGMLTYNMNWSSLGKPAPTWMHNPYLTTIGVSVYNPLTDKMERLKPAALPALWREKVRLPLDSFARTLNKPVLISEIGYRNSEDALYEPWRRTMITPADPIEQAGAYNAALANVLHDPYIAGIFFWAWSFPLFQPNGLPAAKVLHGWYTSLGC